MMKEDFSRCYQFLKEWSMSICLWKILDMKNLTCQEYANTHANLDVPKGSPASGATLPCICVHTLNSSPPSSMYGPLCRCDHFRHEVCLHLITVLITDDLSLIEWVCSCTINLKAQWTVRGHSKNKTTLFCVQREQALSVWHPSWTIFKGKTSSKPQKLWYCK